MLTVKIIKMLMMRVLIVKFSYSKKQQVIYHYKIIKIF